MEQARYWMWMKRKHDQNSSPNSFGDTREEEAFAEDVVGCIWPPRCYSCTFCKREFKSAQALGGHMNVHRRDRAILKFSPNLDHSPKLLPFPNHFLSPQNPPSSTLIKGQYSGIWNHPGYTGSDVGPILIKRKSSAVLNHLTISNDERPGHLQMFDQNSDSNQEILSSSLLSLTRVSIDGTIADDEMIRSCKRQRRHDDDEPPLTYLMSNSGSEKDPCLLGVDVLKVMSPNHLEEALDLELRLGDPPKVKY